MIQVSVILYFLFGLWSAERFRELAPTDTSWGVYVVTVLLWPAVWFMDAIAADIPEPEKEKEEDDEV